jgi:hypothetical protein
VVLDAIGVLVGSGIVVGSGVFVGFSCSVAVLVGTWEVGMVVGRIGVLVGVTAGSSVSLGETVFVPVGV